MKSSKAKSGEGQFCEVSFYGHFPSPNFVVKNASGVHLSYLEVLEMPVFNHFASHHCKAIGRKTGHFSVCFPKSTLLPRVVHSDLLSTFTTRVQEFLIFASTLEN